MKTCELHSSSLPIRVSEDGRYFIDGRGQPFFWLGDTGWPLFGRYDREDAEAYLDDRARKGFNVILCVLALANRNQAEDLYPGPNYAGQVPFREDPSHPNEAYFENVDTLLRYAADRNLILAMLPAWGSYFNDYPIFTPQSARGYGRWLGRRYRGQPNLVWVTGGDRVPAGNEETYRALACGLREGDEGSHLITYHPCGWNSSAYFFHHEAWLDFNMIQTWADWPKVHPAVLADVLLQPAKPVVLGEPAYEDGPEYPSGPIDPLIVRRQAWWTFMAGGFYTYGQNQMWRMDAGWTTTFDTPGARQMSVFQKIATSRSWWRRVPDQGLFYSGSGSERTLNTAIRSVDNDWAIVYLSSQSHALIYLGRILTRQVKATWINPSTGEQRDAGVFATGNQTKEFVPLHVKQWFSTPDFWEDAVLLLDRI